ncbi:hypothetical protein AVEN_119083-1 [Araneus ventricosus]|uniref:Uncharacterized protein n=1 Tax=Araneus ventricosus TaxID=182803 RepID=A0A4Y2BNB8_ARAVE|nr:hypothetical protein AVEN_119083-1 [Araneus ventricosus]
MYWAAGLTVYPVTIFSPYRIDPHREVHSCVYLCPSGVICCRMKKFGGFDCGLKDAIKAETFSPAFWLVVNFLLLVDLRLLDLEEWVGEMNVRN